jgi:hypothetical protein
MEDESPPHFAAERAAVGAVSKTGAFATLEFVADGERLWLTVPVAALKPLAELCAELEALASDAKNGVAGRRYAAAEE